MNKVQTKKSYKSTVILVITIAVIIIITAALIFLNRYYSPIKSVERIFSLRANMNLEEYYNYFDIPENSKNPCNSLDAYLAMANEKGWEKIESFDVKQIDSITFEINYSDITEKLTVIKDGKKELLFFDTYKIKIESVTSPLMYFLTHKGASITIDGKTVDKSFLVSESDIENAYTDPENIPTDEFISSAKLSNIARKTPLDYFEYYDDLYDNYCFINVFDKKYSFNITTDYTDPFESVATPSLTPLIYRELTLSEKSETEIKNTAEQFMKEYYYAMQDGEDFNAITHMITENPEYREKLRHDYEELYELFVRNENKHGLIDICFIESSSNVSYPGMYDINQAEYIANVTLRYSYNFMEYDVFTDSYNVVNDLFDETYFYVRLVKENGRWVVSRIADTTLNLYF